MNKILNLIKGSVRIEITGYSPERFLNLCKKHGIKMWNLYPTSKGYALELSVSSFSRLKPLLKKSGTRIHILQKRGIPFLCFRYRKHKCFFAGVVLGVFLLYLLSGFIWNIEIDGNVRVTDQTLKEYMKENGVGAGMLKQTLQTSELEKMLRDTYPEIVWVSVTVRGTKLAIHIQETMSDSQKEKGNEKAQDLVSPVDGTVISIVTRSGTPQVEAGAKVEKGTVLVSGCISYTNDNGEISRYTYVKADADVWIDGTVTYEESFENRKAVYTAVGKKRKWCRIYRGHHYMELGLTGENDQMCKMSSTMIPLVIGKDFRIPLQVQWFSLESEKKTVRKMTEEEIREFAEKKIVVHCKKMQKNGFQIQQKDVKIKFNEKTVNISGIFRVSVRADSYRETEEYVPEMKEGQETNGIDTGSDGNSG